jgi:hypothetical protein
VIWENGANRLARRCPLIRRTIEVADETEWAAVAQALALVRELNRRADATPDGPVLAVLEQAAVEQGRRFTRQCLQDVLHAQATDLEKTGGAAGRVPVGGHDATTAAPSGGSSPPPAR